MLMTKGSRRGFQMKYKASNRLEYLNSQTEKSKFQATQEQARNSLIFFFFLKLSE